MLKKKLLLADDDVDDRNFFYDYFNGRSDFELLPAAENGLDLIKFLDTVATDTDLPDLIVIDQNMPKMNGKQTLEFLKSKERYAHIPIIIYSTYRNDQLIKDCAQSGASLVAAKPSTLEGYNQMIREFLQVLPD